LIAKELKELILVEDEEKVKEISARKKSKPCGKKKSKKKKNQSWKKNQGSLLVQPSL